FRNKMLPLIVAAVESGEGFLEVSKKFETSSSTVRNIICKLKTFKTIPIMPNRIVPCNMTMAQNITVNPQRTS
uniref:HTH psq-type domain-containing protein n=1 Tax=Xiphophorus couchianus TaxID=32473 RepID=A0A3B5LUG7_9TELE